MRLSPAEIAAHPNIIDVLKERARQLLALHVGNPRSAGIFATHQRWLLAHIGLAAHFNNAQTFGRAGMYASHVADAARDAGVSSRNTAEAFLREMVAYGFIEAAPDPGDHRIRRLVVTPAALKDVSAWLYGNLATLDALDRGQRAATFAKAPESLAVIQTIAARAFLESPTIREPGSAFALFSSMDEGGAVMDRLFSTHQDPADEQGRHVTGISNIAEFGENVRLSRSHLSRKLRAAEGLGAVGWTGARGRSPMWISRTFVAEYVARQAAELAAIEAGYLTAFASAPG